MTSVNPPQKFTIHAIIINTCQVRWNSTCPPVAITTDCVLDHIYNGLVNEDFIITCHSFQQLVYRAVT